MAPFGSRQWVTRHSFQNCLASSIARFFPSFSIEFRKRLGPNVQCVDHNSFDLLLVREKKRIDDSREADRSLLGEVTIFKIRIATSFLS